MDLLQSVMNSSSHAMFTLDREGIITHINRQAKNRFGLFNHSQYSHAAGRLEPGDLVIVADSAIGADDGNLRPADLERLGIQDRKIRSGDMFVAIGAFDLPGSKPAYKFLPGRDADVLRLESVHQGTAVRASIGNRIALAAVGETEYVIRYFRSIGQIVVIDGKTGQVKFWQENGYSARREGVGNLLRGGAYIAKSPTSRSRSRAIIFGNFLRANALNAIWHR